MLFSRLRISSGLVALLVGAGVVAVPRGVAAQELEITPPAASGFTSQSTVWTAPPDETNPRASTAGLAFGIGLVVVGSIQVPVGVVMLSSSQIVECDAFRKRGGGNFGCGGDTSSGTHTAGAAVAASGTLALVTGLALTVWGVSRKSDLRVGLGSVSATYRF